MKDRDRRGRGGKGGEKVREEGRKSEKRKRAGERERQEWGEKGDGWRRRREDVHRSQ